MTNLSTTQLAAQPEVTALVVTDRAGALIESSGEIDGEAAGAVHAVATQALARCGDALGLGELERIAIAGARRACVIGLGDDAVVGAYLDTIKAVSSFEKKLEAALGR